MTSEPTVAQVSDVESIVRRYYDVVADLSSGVAALQPLLAPGFRVTEQPNPISLPAQCGTATRRSKASFPARTCCVSRVSTCTRSSSPEIEPPHVSRGAGVVSIDAGPLVAGQELVAEIASFLTVRDGQVVEQETFDCYQPSAQS